MTSYHPTSSPITAANQSNNKNEAGPTNLHQRGPATSHHPKRGSVKAHIQMFGGERTVVQRRLDQLTKKWEKDANKVGKKKGLKTEWYASPKTGTYKKRIVV